ncbi:lon peptidase n-terminal domain and ring finger protein 3 [Stylonychia lemnae]|uniref:Lon peptidase n-terminal domain and ring finger protein 3 n=1 Tax=Stylonychia lemnae TaxID=5949 RepID=A0A078ABA6_STYLE|nr:lon peptidase n-terminal domain and ring finger protein 3 [Stylonychia lemnae]|eukprot:CDW79580.1 lon peptidase n-terminal domain and ring finger protein 3 [Stylonychia lemnae]
MEWTSSMNDNETINSNFIKNVTQQLYDNKKPREFQDGHRQKSQRQINQDIEEQKELENQERKRKQLKKIMDKDIKCSICLHMFVKPISLVCGHTFCQLCIFKFFLNNTRNCPLCRRQVTQAFEKYLKILVLNNQEAQNKKIMQRVQLKFDKNYVPTAYERFIWLINMLSPYFKTIFFIFTPILILLFYAKNLKEVQKSKQQGITLMKELQNDNIFYISNSIDLNYYETLLVRLTQLLFSIFGF